MLLYIRSKYIEHKLSYSRTFLLHWIQSLSSTAQYGEDERGLKFEKLAKGFTSLDAIYFINCQNFDLNNSFDIGLLEVSPLLSQVPTFVCQSIMT